MEKDGQSLYGYQYDSFGSRTGMEDYGKGIQRAYAYDALNWLVQEETIHVDSQGVRKTSATISSEDIIGLE